MRFYCINVKFRTCAKSLGKNTMYQTQIFRIHLTRYIHFIRHFIYCGQ